MEIFYYAYEDLKYKIKKYGLLKCEEDIDSIIEEFRNHHNVGLVKLKKAQLEFRFKSRQVAEEILLELQDDEREDVRLFARRDLFRLYVEQNRPNDASLIYEQLTVLEKEKYMLQFHKALMFRCQNKYLESTKTLSNLLRNIDRVDDLCFLENCLSEIENNHWNSFRVDNYDSIKKLLKKLLVNSDNREKLGRRYIFLARLEQINKNYFESLNIYRKALSIPDSKTRELAIIGICKCYFMLGDAKLQDYVEFEELKKSSLSEAISLLFEIYCQSKSIEKAEKVLEKAPNDSKTIYNKAKLARLKGENIESLKLYNKCFETSRDFSLKANSLINIIKIYTDIKEYKEAFELVNINRNILLALSETAYYQMYAYLCKKMGIEYDMKYKSYSISQILDYDLNLACEHVKKHERDFENIDFYESHLKKFLIDIREKLDDKEQLLSTVFDYYKVKVFTKDGKETFVKVVVIPDTKDIITCYVEDNLIFTEVEIDDEMEVKPKEKVIKRKSQIDKFNERYNLKRD